MLSQREILGLYRQFHKYARSWDSYSYREYTRMRVRGAFKKNKSLTDPEEINKNILDAQKNLGILIFIVIIWWNFL